MYWMIRRATSPCRPGALAATKASVATSAAESDNGGSHSITILIPCGKHGGSGTGRGDSGIGTVGNV